MKNVALATAALVLAGLPTFAAHADGAGYVGTCRLLVANDTTPTQTLGGESTWNGEVNLLVVAAAAGSAVTSAGCSIKVTDSGTETPVLSATTPLPAPVAAGAGPLRFTADISDTVYLCTHVSIDNGPESDDCVALITILGCPPTVCEGPGPGPLPDPLVCSILLTLAPTVDALPTAAVLYVEPDTGDLYVGGTAPEDLFWDCPPYVV